MNRKIAVKWRPHRIEVRIDNNKIDLTPAQASHLAAALIAQRDLRMEETIGQDDA